MIMADLINDLLNAQAIAPAPVTATFQGPAVDMSNSELSTNAFFNCYIQTAANLTSANGQIEECATTNGTWTVIPGTVVTITGTTAPGNVFQGVRGLRTLRYARLSINTYAAGTVTGSLVVAGSLHGLKKISPEKSGTDTYPMSSPPLGS